MHDNYHVPSLSKAFKWGGTPHAPLAKTKHTDTQIYTHTRARDGELLFGFGSGNAGWQFEDPPESELEFQRTGREMVFYGEIEEADDIPVYVIK